MHRFARRVDLPVLAKLPVERAAQPLEDVRRRFVPAGRGHEGLRHGESRRLQHLPAHSIANIDSDGLQVNGFAFGVTHEPGRDVHPDRLAVLADVALVDAIAWRLARKHPTQRVLARHEVLRVRQLQDRDPAQLLLGVTHELPERFVG